MVSVEHCLGSDHLIAVLLWLAYQFAEANVLGLRNCSRQRRRYFQIRGFWCGRTRSVASCSANGQQESNSGNIQSYFHRITSLDRQPVQPSATLLIYDGIVFLALLTGGVGPQTVLRDKIQSMRELMKDRKGSILSGNQVSIKLFIPVAGRTPAVAGLLAVTGIIVSEKRRSEFYDRRRPLSCRTSDRCRVGIILGVLAKGPEKISDVR